MPARATVRPKPIPASPARADLDTIKALGSLLDDLELVRIMNGNRVGALEREHGEALPHLLDIQERIAAIEHLAHLELVRAWRKHPLAAWAKTCPGIGEKSIARLIAIIGDPGERPNVAKLWAYCGHGDARRKRAKGMSQVELFLLGNPRAKKQVWLIASKCVEFDGKPDKKGRPRVRSPYRDVYDARRAETADRPHESTCVRCGPSGHPAPAGSPWSKAHQHADAIRVLGKSFLRDLWIASRHRSNEPHAPSAGGDS